MCLFFMFLPDIKTKKPDAAQCYSDIGWSRVQSPAGLCQRLGPIASLFGTEQQISHALVCGS